MNLRTWGWLDLLSSIPMLEVARLGRAAQALRIIRVLRGIRATRVLSQLILQRRSESTMLAATLAALLLIVVSSIAILNVENEPGSDNRTAGDAGDAESWGSTTIISSGCGDKCHLTSEGRAIAVVLMVVGKVWADRKCRPPGRLLPDSGGIRLALLSRFYELSWMETEKVSLVTFFSHFYPVRAFDQAVISS